MTLIVDERATAFLDSPHGHWVDGRDAGAPEHELPVIDPATGARIATVAAGTAEDVDRAVRSARAAFADRRWAGLAPARREAVLRRVADLLEEHAEELAALDTLDNGMPLWQARDGVASSAAHLRYFAGWATKLEGSTITPSQGSRYPVFVRREPVGVIGAVIAWNTPLVNAVWKIGAALASGNSLVLKPAEETPLTALRLAGLATLAGLPDGVLNVVTGVGEVAGAALTGHPGLDRVAFTGSTDTGRLVAAAAAQQLTRASLELGGKSPVIVLPDVDLDAHAERIVAAVMFNAGQICTAGTRVYVHRDVADAFYEATARIAGGLRVGRGLDPDTQVGPVVSRVQHERVLDYIEAGSHGGATLVTGGAAPVGAAGGYFVAPTIFKDVDDTMPIAREEIFGPVMSVLEFDDLDDVVRRANDSPYGLAAGVWTSHVATAHRLADRLQVGTVWINCYNQFDPAVPFGGYKHSGYGRELGQASLEACTHYKTVWVATD